MTAHSATPARRVDAVQYVSTLRARGLVLAKSTHTDLPAVQHDVGSNREFDAPALSRVSSRLRRLEGEFDGVTEIGLGVTNVNFLKGTNADRPRRPRARVREGRLAADPTAPAARGGILVM